MVNGAGNHLKHLATLPLTGAGTGEPTTFKDAEGVGMLGKSHKLPSIVMNKPLEKLSRFTLLTSQSSLTPSQSLKNLLSKICFYPL
ncbi:hypothetical protein CVT25_008463 [Psilocybe cyanescens]|uniref:Uncharacterized protein n=1 Tax=Psilocybe cyanescens TaxID=93625 RepID=A0A409XA05_PSICY|nr:hypothetical protein CVT25_008463 [Psilocybe cyanescens]